MVEEIGLMRSSLNQKGYRHLTAEQGERAQSLLEGLEAPVKRPRSPTKPLPRAVIDSIPIEQGKVEAYDTKTNRTACRLRTTD